MKLLKNMEKNVDISIDIVQYEYEFTCIACGYNSIKRKQELSKVQQKLINFIKRIKNAEPKTF